MFKIRFHLTIVLVCMSLGTNAQYFTNNSLAGISTKWFADRHGPNQQGEIRHSDNLPSLVFQNMNVNSDIIASVSFESALQVDHVQRKAKDALISKFRNYADLTSREIRKIRQLGGLNQTSHDFARDVFIRRAAWIKLGKRMAFVMDVPLEYYELKFPQQDGIEASSKISITEKPYNEFVNCVQKYQIRLGMGIVF